MAKNSVTYEQVAQACQTIINEKQKLTLRAIVSITGGSPNNVLKYWKQWRQQHDEIATAAIEEELSSSVKQAMLAECARKTIAIKELFTHKVAETEQQLLDLQKLFEDNEQQLAQANSKIIEQDKQLAVSHQQLIDMEQRVKEMEERYRAAILAQERTQTEKESAEKQINSLQNRLSQLENEFKTLQASKHERDLEIATLKTRQAEMEKQLK